MKYLINLSEPANLIEASISKIPNVLVQAEGFSKIGKISIKDLPDILNQLTAHSKNIILEWNCLERENELEDLAIQVAGFLPWVKAVRFMDPGVGAFLKSKLPTLPLQFSMEYGNPNEEGILAWVEAFGPSLERIILSNQMPISQIAALTSALSSPLASPLAKKTKIEIELLGLGRLETFYSPRLLLSPVLGVSEEEYIEIETASEDRPHQVNALIQNDRGTIMYYDKDLCIMDLQEEAEKAGVSILRIEAYESEHYNIINQHFTDGALQPSIKQAWPKPTTRGFFRVNKTDKPLERLTNPHLKVKEKTPVARIIEAKKGSHCLIQLERPLQLPAQLQLKNPEGREAIFDLTELENLQGVVISEKKAPVGIYLMSWIKYSLPSSRLLLVNPT